MILDSLYGLVVWTRNRLYDLRVLPSYKGELPTIVVGNLAVGGTGKTPHTEFIVRQLQAEGKHPAILSRGYKRKSKGFQIETTDAVGGKTAAVGGRTEISDIRYQLSAKLGDEAALLHHHLPDVPIAVCRDRIEGIKKIKERCPEVDIVVLDDAMQYRRLVADTTVLLTKYNHLYNQDAYLPWGTLRDHKTESKRADIIIVTDCPNNLTGKEKELISGVLQPLEHQQVLFSSIQYLQPKSLFGQPVRVPDNSRIGVFAGIANPKSFFGYVEQTFGKPQKCLTFADHHWYSEKDIRQFMAEDIDIWLTTEKDAMRLPNEIQISTTLKNKIAYLPIEIYYLFR